MVESYVVYLDCPNISAFIPIIGTIYAVKIMKLLQNIFKDKLYIFIKINIFSLMNEPLPDVSHKSRSRKKGNTTALRVQPVLQQTIDDSPASESSEEETFQEDQPPQQIAVSTKVARKRQGNTPQRMNPTNRCSLRIYIYPTKTNPLRSPKIGSFPNQNNRKRVLPFKRNSASI